MGQLQPDLLPVPSQRRRPRDLLHGCPGALAVCGERPPDAPARRIGLDGSYLEATELGPLARVFFQDEYNVGYVQKGLYTMVENKPGVTFGAYQETKFRHFYALYRHLLSPA